MRIRTCTRCQTTKPLSSFYFSRKRNKYRPACIECHSKSQKKYREGPDGKTIVQAGKLRRRYGISMEEFEQLNCKQQGVCAICREMCEKNAELSVDHCHRTGAIRGLLCNNCNTGLGMLKDDITSLQRAIKYLKKKL